MRRSTKIILILLAEVFLIHNAILGISATIANDGAAYNDGVTTWNGTADFYYTEGGPYLEVAVDYAVYAPGDYPGGITAGPGHYLYAYQVFTQTGSTEVSNLSVAILAKATLGSIGDDLSYGVSGGITPLMSGFTANSAIWSFLGNTVSAEEFSDLLYFTSPDPPVMASATLYDSGLSAMSRMPTPYPIIPEPSLMILVCATAIVAIRKAY